MIGRASRIKNRPYYSLPASYRSLIASIFITEFFLSRKLAGDCKELLTVALSAVHEGKDPHLPEFDFRDFLTELDRALHQELSRIDGANVQYPDFTARAGKTYIPKWKCFYAHLLAAGVSKASPTSTMKRFVDSAIWVQTRLRNADSHQETLQRLTRETQINVLSDLNPLRSELKAILKAKPDQAPKPKAFSIPGEEHLYRHRVQEQEVRDCLCWWLKDSASQEGTSPFVVIEGGSGTGKSWLANWAMHSFRSNVIGVAYVDLSSFEYNRLPIRLDLDSLIEPVQSPSKFANLRTDEDKRADLVRTLRRAVGCNFSELKNKLQREGKKCLIVLDSLETLACDAVYEWIKAHLKEPRCAFLCTTLGELPRIAVERPINLDDGMTGSEAIETLAVYWKRQMGSHLKDDDLSPALLLKIAKLCSYQPLALQLVASSNLMPSQAFEKLSNFQRDLNPDFLSDFQDIHALRSGSRRQFNLFSTIYFSWIHLLSHLEADVNITTKAFKACGLFAGPFESTDLAAIAGEDLDRAARALRHLESASLARKNRVTDRWGLHSHIRAFALACLRVSDDDSAIRTAFRKYFWDPLTTSRSKEAWTKGSWEWVILNEPNWVEAGLELIKELDSSAEARQDFKSARPALDAYGWNTTWNPSMLLLPALDAFLRVGDLDGAAFCYRTLAQRQMKKGNVAEADDLLLSARKLFRKTRNMERLADVVRCCADTRLMRARGSDGALRQRHCHRAKHLFSKAIHLSWGYKYIKGLSVRGFAEVFQLERDHVRAFELFNEAKQIFLSDSVPRMNNVADCEFRILELHKESGRVLDYYTEYKSLMKRFVPDQQGITSCRIKMREHLFVILEENLECESRATIEAEIDQLTREIERYESNLLIA